MLGIDGSLYLGFNGAEIYPTVHFMNSPILVYKFFVIPQAWSLSLELLFYIVAPFLLLTVKRMVLTLAASLGIIILMHLVNLPTDPFTHRFFPSILYLFIFGAIACHLIMKTRLNARVSAAGWGGGIILCSWIIFWRMLPMIEQLKTGIFLAGIILFIGPLFLLSKHNKFDRMLGELSYPIYIVHILALTVIQFYGGVYSAEIAVILTLFLSTLLVIYVELPMERWRAAFTQRALK